MAQIKGILVNDGGAPARIINFVAAAAISAGECLRIDGAGKAALATDPHLPIAGVALTDVSSGAQCSMVTGSGVILYVVCEENVSRGASLMTDTASGSTAGSLITWAVGTSDDLAVACALEDAPALVNSVRQLTKVLVF